MTELLCSICITLHSRYQVDESAILNAITIINGQAVCAAHANTARITTNHRDAMALFPQPREVQP